MKTACKGLAKQFELTNNGYNYLIKIISGCFIINSQTGHWYTVCTIYVIFGATRKLVNNNGLLQVVVIRCWFRGWKVLLCLLCSRIICKSHAKLLVLLFLCCSLNRDHVIWSKCCGSPLSFNIRSSYWAVFCWGDNFL